MDRALGVKNALSGYKGPSTAKQQQEMSDKYGAAPEGKQLWGIKNGKAEWKTPEEAEVASKDFLDYNTPEGRAYFNQQLESGKKENAQYLKGLKPENTTEPTVKSGVTKPPQLEFSKPPTIGGSAIPESPKASDLGGVLLSTPPKKGTPTTLSGGENRSDSDVLKGLLKGTQIGELSPSPVVHNFENDTAKQLRAGVFSDKIGGFNQSGEYEDGFYYERSYDDGREGTNRYVKIKGLGMIDPITGLIVNK